MFAKKLYEDISEGRERLELEYYSTVYSNLEGRKDYAGEMAEEYLNCLQNNLDDDIRAGFTQKGVIGPMADWRAIGLTIIREYANTSVTASASFTTDFYHYLTRAVLDANYPIVAFVLD